jgi:multicomponent K+:H+ antiporter subunit A
VAYSVRFVHDVFFNGEPARCRTSPHEPPRWMRVPVELLVVLCLLVGVLPALTIGPVLHASAAACWGSRARVQPGDLARLQRAAADEHRRRAGGIALYLFLRATPTCTATCAARSAARCSCACCAAAAPRSCSPTLLENGSLQRYLALLVLAALALAAAPLWGAGMFDGSGGGQPLPWIGSGGVRDGVGDTLGRAVAAPPRLGADRAGRASACWSA